MFLIVHMFERCFASGQFWWYVALFCGFLFIKTAGWDATIGAVDLRLGIGKILVPGDPYPLNAAPPVPVHAPSVDNFSVLLLPKLSEEGNKPKRSRVFSDYKMHKNEAKSFSGKNELDVYLDESQVDVDDGEDFDVLHYWKINEKKFSTLSIMARDVLSIPITTALQKWALWVYGLF
ncbi:hypothetical protein VNO77_17115 [Canavalia gladiata]|uniref:HAT C-terminal dimerisation domain-containing protein n=1 Tax=Canavalia gladiata TaxID=3824 RepID=A0AAN9LIE0_CANGL